jgi:hypothetical protein
MSRRTIRITGEVEGGENIPPVSWLTGREWWAVGGRGALYLVAERVGGGYLVRDHAFRVVRRALRIEWPDGEVSVA